MKHCQHCEIHRHCCMHEVYLVSEAECRDIKLVRSIRNTFFWLTIRFELTSTTWNNFIHNCNRDVITTVLNQSHREVFINLDALEASDTIEDEKQIEMFQENLRSYFRDTCCKPVPLNVNPVVHEVNRAKFIAIGSVVAARFPQLALLWPRHRLPPRAANDNIPPTEPV